MNNLLPDKKEDKIKQVISLILGKKKKGSVNTNRNNRIVSGDIPKTEEKLKNRILEVLKSIKHFPTLDSSKDKSRKNVVKGQINKKIKAFTLGKK